MFHSLMVSLHGNKVQMIIEYHQIHEKKTIAYEEDFIPRITTLPYTISCSG